MSRITDQERVAIDAALAEGRVNRIEKRAKTCDVPKVDWENIPRPSRTNVAPVFSRAVVKRHDKMNVQRALEWAFGAEKVQLELPQPEPAEERGFGFGMEYVMIQRAQLGVTIDTSPGRSEPHDDAEAIAAIVANLSDQAGGLRMAIRVSELARAGLTPDWIPNTDLKIEPVEWVMRGGIWLGKAEDLEIVSVKINGRKRPHKVRWTPVRITPTKGQIASARAAYHDWWFALSEIRRNLTASNMLRDIEITGAMPPMQPWG